MAANIPRLRNLILYVSAKCQHDVFWGATKLNKILARADFGFYEKHRRSITDSNYNALEYGPSPSAVVPTLQELVDEDKLVIQELGRQRRPIPLAEYDISDFTAEEISMVDEAIQELRHMDARAASDRSHEFIGWIASRAEAVATGKQVAIPYESVFITAPPVDAFERARVRKLASEHGW
jgi:hypothetical protein